MENNDSTSFPTTVCARWCLVAVFCGLMLAAVRCASSSSIAGEIVVEGEVTARGQEPFVVQVLETDDRNAYVLVLDEAQRRQYTNPARIRVAGVVYVAEWNGRPFTHLRVSRIEPAGS